MNTVQLIEKKRNGGKHSAAEIEYLVAGAVSGEIPKYQLSAWLMAVFFQGLDEAETLNLTQAFIDSGTTVDFSDVGPYRVDKHSTGGVGDKTSLIVVPIVTAAGLIVPMMSGRGLGYTGGTLDKLESVSGFCTELALSDFRDCISRNGAAIIGTTGELVPADRIFYGLRDATATVNSTSLIVASILSKKVAEGADGLVLDVKVGNGGLMKDMASAERLARKLVKTGRFLDKEVVAVISDMSQPLGCAVGNGLEVEEAVQTLRGKGPPDLVELCLELAAWMIRVSGLASSLLHAKQVARKQLTSGAALAKFGSLLEAQGGDAAVIETGVVARSRKCFEFTASEAGFVTGAGADLLGRAAMLLGAGRDTIDDKVNPAAGLLLRKKRGDHVETGQCLTVVHYDREDQLRAALPLLREAFELADQPPTKTPLIRKVIK